MRKQPTPFRTSRRIFAFAEYDVLAERERMSANRLCHFARGMVRMNSYVAEIHAETRLEELAIDGIQWLPS